MQITANWGWGLRELLGKGSDLSQGLNIEPRLRCAPGLLFIILEERLLTLCIPFAAQPPRRQCR